IPRSARTATRSAIALRISAAAAFPSRICAVIVCQPSGSSSSSRARGYSGRPSVAPVDTTVVVRATTVARLRSPRRSEDAAGARAGSGRATGRGKDGASVVEMADPGEVEGDTGALAGLDDQVVADRAARFGDGRDAGRRENVDVVREGEERVAGAHRADRPVPGP